MLGFSSWATLPLFPVWLVLPSDSVLFTCWTAEPQKECSLIVFRFPSCSWPHTGQNFCACLCLLRGTRICLCSVCNAPRTGLLIMPQAGLHSTSSIMNYPAPAKMSHTMATKETYLSPTLSSSCSSLFPFSSPVICLASCNWNIFSRI